MGHTKIQKQNITAEDTEVDFESRMVEGYREMAEENKRLAKQFFNMIVNGHILDRFLSVGIDK